ncbi:uncharacterized protein DS421_13g401430 [Arachis hypogaea]|nr:uncharacterized protein DS421_13g401430 [Arachis hypogaea]
MRITMMMLIFWVLVSVMQMMMEWQWMGVVLVLVLLVGVLSVRFGSVLDRKPTELIYSVFI